MAAGGLAGADRHLNGRRGVDCDGVSDTRARPARTSRSSPTVFAAQDCLLHGPPRRVSPAWQCAVRNANPGVLSARREVIVYQTRAGSLASDPDAFRHWRWNVDLQRHGIDVEVSNCPASDAICRTTSRAVSSASQPDHHSLWDFLAQRSHAGGRWHVHAVHAVRGRGILAGDGRRRKVCAFVRTRPGARGGPTFSIILLPAKHRRA